MLCWIWNETDIDTCREIDFDRFVFEQSGLSCFHGKGDDALCGNRWRTCCSPEIAKATSGSSAKGNIALTWAWTPVALRFFYAYLLSIAQF